VPLLLRILAPQILALAVYVIVRRATRDLLYPQFGAIFVAAVSAAMLSFRLLPLSRVVAFVALELFVSLLAQLLIIGAEGE